MWSSGECIKCSLTPLKLKLEGAAVLMTLSLTKSLIPFYIFASGLFFAVVCSKLFLVDQQFQLKAISGLSVNSMHKHVCYIGSSPLNAQPRSIHHHAQGEC